MTGAELLKLMPKAKGFFAIDELPGVVDKDNQAWIFEGDVVPHPITTTDAKSRGGVTVSPDEAAELFSMQPTALDFLKKNESNTQSSTDLTKPATKRAGGQMKARVVNRRDM